MCKGPVHQKHTGSFCHRAASTARRQVAHGEGRVLANALAWAGFLLSSSLPSITWPRSLETHLCILVTTARLCLIVTLCSMAREPMELNDLRSKPALPLSFSRQPASLPPTLAVVRACMWACLAPWGSQHTLGLRAGHTSGLSVLTGTRRVVKSEEEVFMA